MPASDRNLTSIGNIIANTGRAYDEIVKLAKDAGVQPASSFDNVPYFDAAGVDAIMAKHRATPVNDERRRELLNSSPEGAAVLREERKRN